MKKCLSCAITGHRPTRFKWKYKENNNGCKRLKRRMQEQFALLYDYGVRRFYVGGALGVDMWAGEILLRMKEQSKYGDIELVVALPFEGHDTAWDDRSRNRLKFLINHSTLTVTVGTAAELPAVCYKRRNYYMVDHADCLLAVYDNERSIRSGTGQTVHYAESKGVPIILINPDTAVVSSASTIER
ncbi:SLOG family protein [uncultured Dysosmobacter sp.]|uniref:SLOG family protein n=1 Tax=uncultured Dysosmobacter sp. TaxID=2591384 RepID=UPI00261649E1|nr:SLOG family protein [uncultured Dysosmobacter sp.]